jgi:hypothetical protein
MRRVLQEIDGLCLGPNRQGKIKMLEVFPFIILSK